ncbi:MAG: hypothetical protein HYX60_01820 [Legionella longbeachae]|nr:hypothetical protein [Legionella longbeachae]
MTIFIRTVQALIDRVLNKSIEDSIKEDSGTISGLFRNTKHSEQQRQFTRNLQQIVISFSTEDTDKNNLATIKDLISKTDTAVEKLRAKKSWKRGALNNTLSTLNSNLDRFYSALNEKSFNFIDIADDDDPFNLLCAHAIYYFGEHIICPPDEGMLAKIYDTVSNTISHSTPIEIRAKKEECLMKQILECKRKLNGLDREKTNYNDLRKTFVIEAIQAIQRENAEICQESELIDTIPVQVTLIAVAKIKAPTIKPSRGRLKVAMDNALEEIESRKPVEREEIENSLVN